MNGYAGRIFFSASRGPAVGGGNITKVATACGSLGLVRRVACLSGSLAPTLGGCGITCRECRCSGHNGAAGITCCSLSNAAPILSDTGITKCATICSSGKGVARITCFSAGNLPTVSSSCSCTGIACHCGSGNCLVTGECCSPSNGLALIGNATKCSCRHSQRNGTVRSGPVNAGGRLTAGCLVKHDGCSTGGGYARATCFGTATTAAGRCNIRGCRCICGSHGRVVRRERCNADNTLAVYRSSGGYTVRAARCSSGNCYIDATCFNAGRRPIGYSSKCDHAACRRSVCNGIAGVYFFNASNGPASPSIVIPITVTRCSG